MAGKSCERFVEYYLFPELSSDCNKHKEQLDEYLDIFVASLSDYLVPYIWQNEFFKLSVVDQPHSSEGISPHLYGCTNYGDNVEDEWFIVFLISKLTQNFPNLVARVVDGEDGDFLLVEAANYLPKWMNHPEATENRVYLYEGKIHILPQAQTPQQMTSLPTGTPSILDAVSAIRGFSSISIADKKIQSAVFQRVGRFPEKIKEDHHRAHCFVPSAVAVLLHHRPSLLSKAVNAFYLRDSIDLKACRAMKYFPPETRVMTEVVFTKCLYAQLFQQKYIPDKRTGWNLPPPNRPDYKACDLGMKLACGFEILLSHSNPKSYKSFNTSADDQDLEQDTRWLRYLQSLKSKGYFREEMEHSKMYNELLEKAKDYYLTIMQVDVKNYVSVGEEIHALLNKLDIDIEQLRKEAAMLNPCDDDSWLTISEDSLNDMLKRFNLQTADGEMNESEDLKHISKNITSGLTEFVNHVSSHEGAELPKKKNIRDNRVSFDPDSFADAMQSILDFKVPEWDERSRSSSGMSDYSDENEDIDLSKPTNSKMNSEAFGIEDFSSEMQAYMEQMDRELSTTAVGQSFERDLPSNEKKAPLAECSESSKPEDLDDYQPVNVDLTALKNILQSYQSQQGLPGPASNLLESMGIQIPRDVETCD